MPILVVSLMAGILGILAFWPSSLVLFYVVARPLVQPYAYLGYSLGPIPLTGVLALAVIAAAVYCCLFQEGYTFLPPNVWPLYALLLLSCLSFLYTSSVGVSIAHVLKIATGVAFYLLAYNGVRSEADAVRVLYAVVLSAAAPMAVGFHQYATGTGHAWKSAYFAGNRPDSLFGEWNIYGEFLCLVLIANAALLLRESRPRPRLLLVCALASCLASLVISQNRGSWISVAVGAAAAAFLYREKINLKRVAVGLALVALVGAPTVVKRFSELSAPAAYEGGNTFDQRVKLWGVLLPALAEHPLIGHGIGTAAEVVEKRAGFAMVPHNDYLRLAVETGLPAAAFYALFLLRELARNLRRAGDKSRWAVNGPLLAAVIYYVVISTVQNVVYDVIIFPLMLTLVAVGYRWNELGREPACEPSKRRARARLALEASW
jgi:O-antigen ligase